ncbi:MAG: ATP-binding protein [Caldilineaceae bacterium]|nr:ATP-binding protein [Caldilineaceae bacterium]
MDTTGYATAYAAWSTANQQYLVTRVAAVRAHLLAYIDQAPAPDPHPAAATLAATMAAPPALESLCQHFGLSPFACDLLLLCAGMELDATFAELCRRAQGDTQRPYPTFSLALAALPAAHWSALTPAAPLRHWRLLEIEAGNTLVTSRLRIDERVLHYLTGLDYLDEQLVGFVQPVACATASAAIAPQPPVVEEIAALWLQSPSAVQCPAVQLCGDELSSQRALALAVAARLGLTLYRISAQELPTAPYELASLIRLWEREAMLGQRALLLECDDSSATDVGREQLIHRFIEQVNGVLLVATPVRRASPQRPLLPFTITKPTRQEQQQLWTTALTTLAPALPPTLNGQVQAVVAQFDLEPPAIWSACQRALRTTPAETVTTLGERLWAACRVETQPRLHTLAHRIEPVATWDELVLPERQRQTLRAIAIHVRQREQVYRTWGFAAKSARGLGISALFAGPSGTGKTMAAEVLANELKLDLYRIDLSQVVSKYIGETEKNLGRVFDAAEAGGALLLFDEADALFGKRSEVKDSHDRYANLEVSYLLQRMESYQGLAILTTNLKSALDEAFLRRLRFVVHFPFPDGGQRTEIWRRIFPAQTPTTGLAAEKLAKLTVTGGNIRNIALHAAFLAAEAAEPVQMAHLLAATRVEYAKLEKPLTEAEIRGWL